MSDSEDPIDPIDEDGGDDLFGDEDDDANVPTSPKARTLDDDSLASDPEGDDAPPQYSRARSQQTPEVARRIQTIEIGRHRVPKPSDKALRVMRVPKFLKIHPMTYRPDEFEPTEFDVANAVAEQPQHVVRHKKDPSTGELKSNTNVYRWSDGSVTITVGGEHYEVSKKALGPAPDKPYNELQDGHYYAASVELSSNLLVTVDHITEQYNVRPNKEVGDEALTRLAERMAEATNAGRSENMIVRTTKDPELQKRQAELAEKEREKARRRRENAAAKMDGGLGRSGGRGGLSIGDLEGGRRAGGNRKRGAPGSGKQKRHRPEYDSDDDLPQGVGRHEEYERGDGFVVGSDEEEMDSDVEDDEEEEEEEEAPRRKRQRTVEADEDASGDDVEPAEASTRARRRNIIDEEDDE